MIHYATIDTNILVSYLFDNNSVPGKIVTLALTGEIVPLINDEILREYYSVLTRNKFPFDVNDVFKMLSDFEEKAISLDRTSTDESFTDKTDIVFYEITLTGRSTGDAYLVTGNKKHFPKKHFVVSPREMLEIIGIN